VLTWCAAEKLCHTPVVAAAVQPNCTPTFIQLHYSKVSNRTTAAHLASSGPWYQHCCMTGKRVTHRLLAVYNAVLPCAVLLLLLLVSSTYLLLIASTAQ
jgi:hypothetical protein